LDSSQLLRGDPLSRQAGDARLQDHADLGQIVNRNAPEPQHREERVRHVTEVAVCDDRAAPRAPPHDEEPRLLQRSDGLTDRTTARLKLLGELLLGRELVSRFEQARESRRLELAEELCAYALRSS